MITLRLLIKNRDKQRSYWGKQSSKLIDDWDRWKFHFKTSVKKPKSSTKDLCSIEIFSTFFSLFVFSLNLLSRTEMSVSARIFAPLFPLLGIKKHSSQRRHVHQKLCCISQHLTYVSLTRSTLHSLKSDSAPQPIDYQYTAFRTPMDDCLRAAAS